jgi:hypothetical protein
MVHGVCHNASLPVPQVGKSCSICVNTLVSDAPLALRGPLPWRPSKTFLSSFNHSVCDMHTMGTEIVCLHGSGPRRASGALYLCF